MNVNARMNNGLTLQGGFTTGGGVRDICEVSAKLPELYSQGRLGRFQPATSPRAASRSRGCGTGAGWPTT